MNNIAQGILGVGEPLWTTLSTQNPITRRNAEYLLLNDNEAKDMNL
ncbi:hypothetical protein CAEBREN_10503 [Caenorhabditis brenneri]|uniref:Uncharacterized protein n=1 Tax=Caenorhabditis brenneri TaxID=135651 RepID=G0N530_CAEBE|nr:hypothetical protein CAEBREN_10503 [Caenorhabditis brenneri]